MTDKLATMPKMDPKKLEEQKKERAEDRKKVEQRYRADAQKNFKLLKKNDPKTKLKEKPWVEKQVKDKMQTYDDKELVRLEDIANKIPLEKLSLDALKKRIAIAKKKLDKNPAEKKKWLMEQIEDERQRKFYLERERVLLTGDKGHISDFKSKLEENKKKSVELAQRKIELEKEKIELAKVSKILEQVELAAGSVEQEVEYGEGERAKPADFVNKFMDVKFRHFEAFAKSDERTVLELLLRRYSEDLEQLGREYFSKAKAKDLDMEEEETTLTQHIRNKQIKLKGLEDKRKEYHKKTADLDKQIDTFGKGHNDVKKAVEELGEKLREMEKGHREACRNARMSEGMTEDPKSEALHAMLEKTTKKLSESADERNKVIIGILLTYNTIKPISYRDADGKKAEPFQNAIGQIPWKKIEEQLGELKQMFTDLISEFKTYQQQFLDAKREANEGFIKKPVKEEAQPESMEVDEDTENQDPTQDAPPASKKGKKAKAKPAASKPSKKRVKQEVWTTNFSYAKERYTKTCSNSSK